MTDEDTAKEIAKLVRSGVPELTARAIVLRGKGLISELDLTRTLGYK